MPQALLVLAISVAASVLPTIVYVWLVWWLDRFEKEPVFLLIAAFFWGAVPAVFLSLVLELMAGVPTSFLSTGVSSLLDSSLTAPIVEEVCKGIVLVVLVLLFRGEFDDVLDGIVYGAMVGFGFAMTENVFYFLSAFHTGGISDWASVVFMRTVIFGLNHALFTSITGAGLGFARLARGVTVRLGAPVVALALAATMHGIHNLFANLNDLLCGTVLISLISDWIGVFGIIMLAVASWQKERAWIVGELADEVRIGTITQAQYMLAQSPGRRWRARLSALSRAGWSAFDASGHFQSSLTELAFKKAQLHASPDEQGLRAQIHQLRQEVAALRGVAG